MFPDYQMGVDGPASNFDPPISYWAIPDPHGGGAHTYTIPNGVKFSGDSKISGDNACLIVTQSLSRRWWLCLYDAAGHLGFLGVRSG